MQPRKGARIVPISTVAAASTGRLLGGPLRLCGWSLADAASINDLTVDQSAVAPAAGATIATLSLPNGPWTIEWTFELTGTPGAGDVDNVSVNLGATQIATSVNLGAVGNYQQEEAAADVVNGPVNLTFKAIGVATAGTTYKIEANALPLAPNLGQILDGGMVVANFSVPRGLVDNNGPSDCGVQVDTELALKSLAGAVTGVLYVELNPESPNYDRDKDDTAGEPAY